MSNSNRMAYKGRSQSTASSTGKNPCLTFSNCKGQNTASPIIPTELFRNAPDSSLLEMPAAAASRINRVHEVLRR